MNSYKGGEKKKSGLDKYLIKKVPQRITRQILQ